MLEEKEEDWLASSKVNKFSYSGEDCTVGKTEKKDKGHIIMKKTYLLCFPENKS